MSLAKDYLRLFWEPVKNLGKEFDAQTAAILGFSIFSTKNYYLLNDNGELNIDILKKFLQKNKNQNFIYLIYI